MEGGYLMAQPTQIFTINWVPILPNLLYLELVYICLVLI